MALLKSGWLLAGVGICFLASQFAYGIGVATPSRVTLEWNRNGESDVAGYELRYSEESSSVRPVVVNVGNRTRWTLSGLKPNTTYGIAVRAYNRAGLRSAYAAPISHTTSPEGPPIGENQAPDTRILSPSTGGTVVTGQPVRFSAFARDPDGGIPSIRWDFGAGSGLSAVSGAATGPIRFSQPGIYRVTATAIDAQGLADPTPDSRVITVLAAASIISREHWSLKFANSEEPANNPATAAFDGDPKTFWHTRWISGSTPPPHIIELDLGTARHIKGFRYLPRQDGFTVGNIGRYAFYVSMDGIRWGSPAATGTFDGSSEEKQVIGASRFGRFVRLVGLSEINGNIHSAIAELNILSGPPPNRRPSGKSRFLATARNTKLNLTIRAADPDGNPLTFRIRKQPAHGKLTGTFPNFVYTPKAGFEGKDEFTFTVDDGSLVSRTAKVRIQVRPAKPQRKKALAAISRGSDSSSHKPTAAVSAHSRSQRLLPVMGSVSIDGSKYLTLTVDRSLSSSTGREPLVEVSSDLVNWFSGSRHTTVLIDNETILKVRDNTPTEPGRKRYIRLKPTTR